MRRCFRAGLSFLLAAGLQQLPFPLGLCGKPIQMSSMKSSEPVAQEPTLFEIAVRERSWDWLFELRRRLKLEMLLVDGRPSMVLPASPGDQSARLVGLLEQPESGLLSAVDAAVSTRTSHGLEVGGLQIVCMSVAIDGGNAGALLLAKAVSVRPDGGATREQLQLVASWLATAVEAHLLSPPAFSSSGLGRVAPLAQVLGQAAEGESDRELMRLFGEAVAVWHDIEVCAYVETANGAFARDVTLPGSRRGERPAAIAPVELPDSQDLARLPQGHHDRFGLPVSSDVYVKRVKRGDGRSWLLVFTGVIDSYDLQRLGAYLALLELALSLSTTALITRVVTAVSRRLGDVNSTAETRASGALEEIRTALGAATSTLTIVHSSGSPLLEVTSPPRGAGGSAEQGPLRLVLVKRSERDYTTTVSLGRYESLQFTPRDHAVASAAASMLEVWAPATLGASGSRPERRAAARGFHEVIERSAREAIERGMPVAVVVLLIRDAVSLPGATQRWVAGIRGQMRASDVAGMLAEGEIGLLLHDTANEQAKEIGKRLRVVVNEAPGPEAILIGVATRSPGQGPADGMIREARADALGERRRSQVSASTRGVNH